MPTNPPFSAEQEQRQLAAIVFTDVAAFSRRVQEDEAMTLKLLERDFVSMRAFCAMHSGRVIKSTGDGLMLFFTSAVQAVEWALKAQRHFADQAADLPAKEILRHRVGIHLGEVIVGDGDVMGDGVNIAARVQAEAPAGGICISQMVFSVVKNKMKLDIVALEPRQLKNINEPVRIYRVLLEPPVQRIPGTAAATTEPEAAAAPAPSMVKKWVALGAVAGGLVVLVVVLLQAYRAHQQELVVSQRERDALLAAVQAQKVAADTVASEPSAVPAAGTENPPPAAAGGPQIDFGRLALKRTTATDEEKQVFQAANESVAALDGWVPRALERYSRDRPLYVAALRTGSLPSSTLYPDANRQINFVVGGAARRFAWGNLSPEVRGAIIASLVTNSPEAPPAEIVRGAEAFALIHQLPEMAELLLRERATRSPR